MTEYVLIVLLATQKPFLTVGNYKSRGDCELAADNFRNQIKQKGWRNIDPFCMVIIP